MTTIDNTDRIFMKFGFALTLLFATAKLFGFYAMPWLWVFSPIWLPIVLGLVVFGCIVLGNIVIGQ